MRFFSMLLLPVLAMSSLAAHAGEQDVKRLGQLLGQSNTISARFSQLTLDGSGTQLQAAALKAVVARAVMMQKPTPCMTKLSSLYWKAVAPLFQPFSEN